MKIESALATKMSGSVGGLTGSHNAGGMYLRRRSVPKNVRSDGQLLVRAILAQLSNVYSSVLTEAQRQAWRLYAQNVPLSDALGASRQTSAIAHFIRSNSPRVQAGLDRIDDAPSEFNVGPTPNAAGLTVLIDEGPPVVVALGGDVLLGAPNADGNILVYEGRPQNPSINFFKGPYNYQDKAEFASGDPTVTLAITAFPFPLVEGQKVWFKLQNTLNDGRLSQMTEVSAIVAAAGP